MTWTSDRELAFWQAYDVAADCAEEHGRQFSAGQYDSLALLRCSADMPNVAAMLALGIDLKAEVGRS